MPFNKNEISFKCIITLCALIVFWAGCSKKNNDDPKTKANSTAQQDTHKTTHEPATVIKPLDDRPINDTQRKLLDTAFKTASKIPVSPHIKDRSKYQEMVIQSALTLKQTQLALSNIPHIDNWRKGYSYAIMAHYYALNNGTLSDIKKLLDIASKEAEKDIKDWRKNNIKIKVAQVMTLTGQNKASDKIEEELETSDKGRIDQAKALLADNQSFSKQVETLDKYIATGDFDAVKNSLKTYTYLYKTLYSDADKREFIKNKITSSWNPMPYFVRVELLTELTKISIDCHDLDTTNQLIQETNDLINSLKWPVKYKIPIVSKIAVLRYDAGDTAGAKADADLMKSDYENHKQDIVNINRVETLLPLAEAYHKIDQKDTALEIYAMALEESVINPNSRPRAEDLTQICCSMAVNNVQPSQELWDTILQIQDHLSDPW